VAVPSTPKPSQAYPGTVTRAKKLHPSPIKLNMRGWLSRPSPSQTQAKPTPGLSPAQKNYIPFQSN